MAVTCAVCAENESKYTCPKCKCRYCSLKCFRSQKHVDMDNASVAATVDVKQQEQEKVQANNVENEDISDPMIKTLVSDRTFQSYIASPVIQFHVMTILEIINNVSLTNEYSKDGRYEIASRKLNNLRQGGVEENEYVDEFVQWLVTWLEEYKAKHQDAEQ